MRHFGITWDIYMCPISRNFDIMVPGSLLKHTVKISYLPLTLF